MALINAIETVPRLNQTILQQAIWIRELLHNYGQQYDIRSYFETRQREMDDVIQPTSILRQFLARTEPPLRERFRCPITLTGFKSLKERRGDWLFDWMKPVARYYC